MAIEIERKFLVKGDFSAEVYNTTRIMQGYICTDPERNVRIRIRGKKGFLTIKGKSDNEGLSRFEFEKEITLPEAEMLLKLCKPGVIDKERNLIRFDGHIWEVDVFHGANEGLILAEIELQSKTETFTLPEWIGKEVTGDLRFYNSMLAKHPYSTWKKKEDS